MSFEEFMTLTPGTGIIFDGKDCVVTKVNNTSKGDTDSETDCLTGDRITYTSLRSARELEISYVDQRTGRIEHLYPSVFTDFPNSTHNHCVLNRMKTWDPFMKT